MIDNKKRYLVAGTGKSGVAAAKLLVEKGFSVRLYDGNEVLYLQLRNSE